MDGTGYATVDSLYITLRLGNFCLEITSTNRERHETSTDQGRWMVRQRLDFHSACDATRLPLQNPPTTRIADVPDEVAGGKPKSAAQNLNTGKPAFTEINPHLGILGPSKFCPYIQICSYKHGPYMWASLYNLFRWRNRYAGNA